jgi:molecular chaperone GrpE
MIKKKMPDKEEQTEKKKIEIPDNKDINNKKEPAGISVEEASAVTGEEEQETEGPVPEAAASDKVVPPEKTFEEKLAEMQDKYIRLSAEFDNYRKRTLREKIELSKYASENILLQILPFMDDFERAINHIETANECAGVKDGIDLIYIKFKEFLKQNGVTEIESLNCPFNFDLHDAVAKIAVQDEDKKGKIVEVIQKGYYLQDKVIRHSKVVVGE